MRLKVTKGQYRELVARRIKALRIEKNMTQHELANHSGIARGTILNYEKGHSVPGGMELLKLTNTLGFSVDFILLFGEVEVE